MKKVFCISLFFLFSCNILKAADPGYGEWIKRRDALKQDRSVVAYYTFENLKEKREELLDLSANGRHLKYSPYKDIKTGKVYDDLQVIEGRWKEKPAARMVNGFFQGAPINIENKQFTVECWFRRHGEGLNVLLSSAGFRDGWQMGVNFWQGRSDEVYLGIGRPVLFYATVTGKKALPENTWHHFAATWDGKMMKVYINGSLATSEVEMVEMEGDKRKKVKREKYDGEYFPTKTPFQLNMGAGTVNLDRSDVTLDLDEVVIYNRALNGEEIALLGKGPVDVSEKDVFSKADAFIRAGDYKGARSEYVKLEGLPSYGKELALFNIAESYRQQKDYSNTHKTYKEILAIPGLTAYYRIYGLFRQAEVYLEQKDYNRARQLYQQVLTTKDALEHHLFTARLNIGDTYKSEKKYGEARPVYKDLLQEQETSSYPHEGYRVKLIERLESIDGLKDGETVKSKQEKWLERIKSPGVSIYVSPGGRDTNTGTLRSPFGSIKRAQEEVRKIKEKGMPGGGIAVCLRGGRYFLEEGLTFVKEDSGTEGAPVVYRSYPGENVRIIGGKEVRDFKLLTDPEIMKRLPEEAKGKVWMSDLKAQGITDYGEYSNRGGYGKDNISAMEVFYEGKAMQVSRWPNKGYAFTGEVPNPEGEMTGRGKYRKGMFRYTENRPERWLGEKDVWLHGYWYFVYAQDHVKLQSIDTENKTISLAKDIRWGPTYPLYDILVGKGMPYYAYNLLSETDSPGEWYLDRDTGILYFYPPEDVRNKEIIVSTLSEPIISIKNSSNLVFYNLTLESTRTDGIIIEGGYNNLLAGSTIRNVGQCGVKIENGWSHTVVGCDIYDNGAGGIYMTGGDREKLIPSMHTAENNHIYRFNRFSGGSYANALNINGTGQRASHNDVYDSPSIAIKFDANDHIIGFNEIHDAPSEGREIGIMYTYGEPWYLMNRGNLIRNNFFHHISARSSPNPSQGVNAIHVDAINGGIVMENNIFYRFDNGIANAQPENRIENNLFVDASVRAISQGNRWTLFNTPDGEPFADRISTLASRYLTRVRYKQPPWSYRYPQLFDMLNREKPVGWAMNNVIERNVNTGGPFISISSGILQDNIIRNNWDGEDIPFVQKQTRDFRIRAGSPIFGLTGCDPISQKDIGVYESPLRATWPTHRDEKETGKYFSVAGWSPLEGTKNIMSSVKRISPPAYCTVTRRNSPVEIDGKLGNDEWNKLDAKNGIVVERDHMGKDIKCARSFAWLMYDDENLYIGMKHEPDPFVEGMLPRLKQHEPWFEIGIETQNGAHSQGWWIDDMVTGPIYIFTGKINGELVIHNLFGMPHARIRKLESSIQYKVSVVNDETKEWTSEMKIPLADIGINPKEVEQLAFSIGTYKKAGFFNWIPTGTQLWRVENAGFIKFAK